MSQDTTAVHKQQNTTHTTDTMNTIQQHQTSQSRRRGLTLIELVVVLAILVALVGLVVSLFPGLVARASRSTTASTLRDIARTVQIHYTTSLNYGSGFDSLVNTTGTALYSSIPANSLSQLVLAPLSTPDSQALSNLGITNVYHVTAGASDATFLVTQTGTSIAVQNGAPVATIASGTTTQLLRDALTGNYQPSGTPTYVVLGLNRGSTLVGPSSVFQEAPVRTGSSAGENPTTSYQRYGLVFLVDGTTTRSARFLGAVAFTASGIQTAEGNLQGYYTN